MLALLIVLVGVPPARASISENVKSANSSTEISGTPNYANISSWSVSLDQFDSLRVTINLLDNPANYVSNSSSDFYIGFGIDSNGDGQGDYFANLSAGGTYTSLYYWNDHSKIFCSSTAAWSGTSVTFTVMACPLGGSVNASFWAWTSDHGTFVETTYALSSSLNWLAGQSCTPLQEGDRSLYKAAGYACHAGQFISIDTYRALANQQGTVKASKFKLPAQKAYYRCAYKEPGVTLADRGKTIVISGAGAESLPLNPSFQQVACIERFLGVPSYIKSQIYTTNSLAGMQKASFGKFKAFWTFHPKNGLNITFHQYK